MLDPISITALTTAITAAARGAAGEAGKQTWNTLTNLVRKAFGLHSPPGTDLTALRSTPDNEHRAVELATALTTRAREQQAFADALIDWLTTVQRDLDLSEGKITNTVSGDVHGSILQGRDFSGPITFGGTRHSFSRRRSSIVVNSSVVR
ncbi:MAG: hypothetical protein ACRDTE_29705 [Pseudonocardiaceae bacterium]